MKTRRGPWLSGLIVALIGAVWMIGQVIGGFLTWVVDLINPVDPFTVSAACPPGSDAADPTRGGVCLRDDESATPPPPPQTSAAALGAPASAGPPATTNGVGNYHYRIERLY